MTNPPPPPGPPPASDILDLDAARRALEDLSRRARLLVDTAGDAIVSIDDASVILDWNPTAERIFGWRRDEAVGRVLTTLIVPERHRESHHRGLARFLADGTPGILNRRVETHALARDGREFDVELSVWPVEQDGRHTFSAFIRDISRRKRAEQALRDSEEKYRAVVENANEGIIVSQDGFLRFMNPRALALTGRTMEEALATPFIEMVHPDDRARVYGNYLRRMRGEEVENFYNFRVVTTAGEVRWLQISAVAIEWGGRPATLNFLSDVTDALAMQEDLRQTLAQREAFLEMTTVGIAFVQEGRIRWINTALEQAMLGWEDGELIGRTGEPAFASHEDWSRFLKEALPALETTGHFETEWSLRRKDGSAWWCQMSARAISPGKLGEGTVWFFLDISSRKRAEEETRRALARERELSELKSRFVALTSHEFRTPLATILSSIELVEDFGPGLPEAERRELFKLVKGAISRMTTMLDQVLLIGRADADRLEFRPAPVDAGALAESLAREVERAHAAPGRIRVAMRGAAGPRALDEKLVRHTLSNLLSNALKYSPAPAPVDFEVEGSREAVTFLVRDRGIGVPADDQPRLFESFHRARNVGNVEGTGLGLTIVKQCVELHGGTVDFESRAGEGTTFIVCLPGALA